MKTKIILTVLLVFPAVLFFLSKPPAKENANPTFQTTNTDTTFFIGSYDLGNAADRRIIDSAKFNQWHKYLGSDTAQGRSVPLGWFDYDVTFTNPNTNPRVKGLLDSNNNQHLYTFMHRPNIDWLCFGQRSDYQCEDSCFLSPDEQDFWFYTYRNTGTVGINLHDYTQFGNGARVKYCTTNESVVDSCYNRVNPHSAGYVVMGLKANREQVNATTYPGSGDCQYDWFIKPRIRINVADAYANKLVCRIEVYNFEGDTIKKVELYGKHFIDNSNNYDGSYRDNYYHFPTDTNLIIDTGYYFNPNKKNWLRTDDSCKVDFRVYWYGQCDMWLDYVRVDDEKANRLLTGSDDEYNNMLGWEAQLAVYNNSPLRFYLDEFEFNHLPCLKYVSKKLRELTAQYYGREVPFSIGTNAGWLSAHTPGCVYLPDYYFRKYFVDSVKIKELMLGIYPFKYRAGLDSIPSKIPNTLPDLTNPGVFGTPVNPNEYDC
ncbi:MAG: hypothetical protein NTV87_11605 [Ignavibacteriae bacterium]|nr:hypothetical protein [Ignavibacteriota bacterium]